MNMTFTETQKQLIAVVMQEKIDGLTKAINENGRLIMKLNDTLISKTDMFDLKIQEIKKERENEVRLCKYEIESKFVTKSQVWKMITVSGSIFMGVLALLSFIFK